MNTITDRNDFGFWTSLSPAWRAALEQAWTAYRHGSFPIGAAISDAGGNVVARGRNGIHDSGSDGLRVREHPLAHAEINALLAWDGDRESAAGYALHTTMEPCPLCLGAFYMSGLRTLHYAARDPFGGSLNLLGATPYLARKAIVVCPPFSAPLSRVLGAMHTEFLLRRGRIHSRHVVDAWRAECGDDVALGEDWHESGFLQSLRAGDGLSTRQAFEEMLLAAST